MNIIAKIECWCVSMPSSETLLKTFNSTAIYLTNKLFEVIKTINKLIHHFAEKPKTLFLIDSLGALLTSFFLFVIMWQLAAYFGMPKTVLTYLFAIAICLWIYSTTCFLFLKRSWAPFIRLIAIANLLYCALTIGLLIKYYSLLTMIGMTYFVLEMVIICVLSCIEFKVAKIIVRGY